MATTVGLRSWSTTAASNNTADTNINWAEGMPAGQVDDSARAEMASMAKWRDDNSGSLVTTGSTTAFTVSCNQTSTSMVANETVTVKFHATPDTSATLNRDSVGAFPLQKVAGTNLAGGEYQANEIHTFTYLSSGSGQWVERGGHYLQNVDISTGVIALSKIANQATNTVLGNTVGADGPPVAITLGTGLSVASATSTAPTLSAPAFPPTSSYKNLSIKVTGNSSATVAADFVTMATSGSTNFNTLPVSSNINLATTGADALDAGSLASGTIYAVYAIATTTSTIAKGLASTSFTTPTMPASYVYKARIGALVTSTSTASAQLMGTWQFANRARYVVGLAQTSAPITVAAGSNGNTVTPVWVAVDVSKYVPSTATSVAATLFTKSSLAVTAPTTSSAGVTSSGNAPPVSNANSSGNYLGVPFIFQVQTGSLATAFYWATGDANANIQLNGWDDNL